ncbi:MAG: hypothetical protein AAGF88_02325 [Pseudomonadota bacterium]
MSFFAALTLVAATLIVAFAAVSAVAAWADRRPQGMRPFLVGAAIVVAILVQMALPAGPTWANVPTAFAVVIGSMG